MTGSRRDFSAGPAFGLPSVRPYRARSHLPARTQGKLRRGRSLPWAIFCRPVGAIRGRTNCSCQRRARLTFDIEALGAPWQSMRVRRRTYFTEAPMRPMSADRPAEARDGSPGRGSEAAEEPRRRVTHRKHRAHPAGVLETWLWRAADRAVACRCRSSGVIRRPCPGRGWFGPPHPGRRSARPELAPGYLPSPLAGRTGAEQRGRAWNRSRCRRTRPARRPYSAEARCPIMTEAPNPRLNEAAAWRGVRLPPLPVNRTV